jgi:hypothetical protein
LRALILIDLKVGELTHADTGQMDLYLNHAREHRTHQHENPPVGLILCSERNEAVAYYALGNLGNQVLAREYKLTLPSERRLHEEMTRTLLALRHRFATSKDTETQPRTAQQQRAPPFPLTCGGAKLPGFSDAGSFSYLTFSFPREFILCQAGL